MEVVLESPSCFAPDLGKAGQVVSALPEADRVPVLSEQPDVGSEA